MPDIDNELEQELDLFEEGEVLPELDEEVKVKKEESIFEVPEKEKIIEPDSIVETLLQAKGITDSKITTLDENNEETQIDFYNLSKEEQLEILNASEPVEKAEPLTPTDTSQFGEGEEELLAYLRENKISLEEYLKLYKEEVVSEVNTSNQSYDIDAYGDEELFLLDLKSKYDLTDEELTSELEIALKDKDLFKKKIDKTRSEYKELETTYQQEEEAKFNEGREEKYQEFVDTMVDVAVKTPEFYGIELEDDEKNDVLSYLLEVDDTGTSEFYKSLNSPDKLYEAAWFLKYGKDAFEAVKDAYETEIKKLKEDKPKVIVKKDTKNQKENSIHNLF